MITAIILFSIAVIIAILSISISYATETQEWSICMLLALPVSIAGIAKLDLTPTDKDVREGEAHYIEQNHIEVVNGDTLNTYKTYQIEWNQNTK